MNGSLFEYLSSLGVRSVWSIMNGMPYVSVMGAGVVSFDKHVDSRWNNEVTGYQD